MSEVRAKASPEESGFTLIEVLVTTVVLGLIASSVAGAIILFFRTTDGTANRLSLSHDSQLLTSYLIPDLDSFTSTPPVLTPATPQPCPTSAGMVLFDTLTVQYTDYSNANQSYAVTYAPDYTLTVPVLKRSLSIGSQPPTTTTVVHNLKPGGACFSALPTTPPWKMTITVEAQTSNHGPYTSSDFSFSVTAGGRVPGPPKLNSLVAMDTAGGELNEIDATFDQPVVANPMSQPTTTDWVFSGSVPTNLTATGVAVSGNTAKLFVSLSGAPPPDTRPPTFTVALQGNGIQSASYRGQPATFPSTAVADGMPPLLVGLSSANGSGVPRQMDPGDTLTLTFSEPLNIAANPMLTLMPDVPMSTNEQLSIAGVGTIDLGTRDQYVQGGSVTFSSTTARAGSSITFTVVQKIAGSGAATQASSSGSVMSFIPASGLTDAAGNHAVAPSPTPNGFVLF